MNKLKEINMGLIRFYAAVIKLAIFLGLAGQLKSCTLVMMNKAAGKREMISYSKFTKMLTAK